MVSFLTNSRTKPAMAAAVRFALLCYLIIGICNFHSVICESDRECKSGTEFKCQNGPTLCIPIERVRDGVPDCPDLSDEACSDDEFKCKGSQECIPQRRVLDGRKDCSDGSDEECQRNQFPCRCGVPRCVNLENVKDGVRDCADGSDEGEGPDIDLGCPDDSFLQDLKGVDRQKRQVGGVQTEIPRRFQPEATPNYGLPAQDGGAAPAYDQYERFQFLRESAVRQPAYESPDDNATPVTEQPVTRNGPRRSVLRRVRPSADLQRLRQPAASRSGVIRRTRVRNHSEHRDTDLLDTEIQPTPVAYYPTETTDGVANEDEDTYSIQPPVVDLARLESPAPTVDDYPATEATTLDTNAQSENEASRNVGAHKPVRRIIRLRRPEASSSNPRKKILVSRRLINGQVASETLQGRGPVNGVGNAVEDTVAHDIEAYTTSPVPLTYYTTYTYYTTFLDGPNTIYTSREAVVSSVATQTIDPDTARVIQSFGGYTNDPSADAVIPLGSRAFGPTTTVVNLASRIQLYNDDVYSGVINTVPFDEATPTQAFSSSVVSVPRPRLENSGEDSEHETKHVSELATLPKTFYTLFTYYYTFYDGDSTRQSVRAETVSSVQSEPSVSLGQPVNNYIDNQGLLTVGPETKIIPLGSREVAGTTTEVNLGMRTIVHFDGLSNVVVQRSNIQPSESYQNLPSATYALPDNQLGFNPDSQPQYVQPGYSGSSILQPSYSSAYDDYSNLAPVPAYESTPLIPQGDAALSTQPIDRRPFRVISSFVQNPGTNLQSRPFLNRPGVRVRVRPVSRSIIPSSSFAVPLYESSVIVPPNQFLDVNDQNRQPVINEQPGLGEHPPSVGTPNLLDGSVTYPNVQPIGEVTSDLNDQFPNHGGRQATPPEESGRPGGRRRLKITVRRPNAIGNITKTNTRFVRPSRFEITSSKPRIYVVTRTGHQGGHVKPSRVPVSVKINRRPKPEGEEDDLPTGRTEYETYTTLTTVPVIFGLETSYRSLLLTTSSAVVVPDDSPTFAQPSVGDVQPTRAVVFTYFTTTTYTVPFTVGDQTLLTTLEETNSRIVTQTIDVQASPTASIPIPEVTSYEFGSNGPTTHIISSKPDGTTTSTVLYPGPDGTIRGTKVIRVDSNGVGFTSMYGSVPENIIPSSAGAQPPQTLPPIQVYGPYQSLGEQPSKSSYITRISDGVTLILASEAPTTQYYPQPSTALTLQPSLVTDAILMKEKESLDPSLTVVHNTRTFYTTYTYFTTFFSDSTSTISSSEQVVSNVVTEAVTQRITPTAASPLPPRSEVGPYQSLPVTVTETSDRLVTSTALSTYTIYATLFNGSSSFVTPLEEVHTQVYTITEPITFTRVIEPTSTVSLEPSTFEVTSTYYTTYTNFVTFLEGPNTVVSSIEETVSSVETLTLFGTRPTATPALSSSITPTSSYSSEVPVYTTKTYFTTQTHYITLFSGSETILSSIEEAGTKVVTEKVDATPSVSSPYSESTAIFTRPTFESDEPTSSITASTVKAQDGDDGGVQLQTSVRTIYTTFTYYTTYFSDTATLVSSREVISTSHVTLFIPKTSTLSTAPIQTTASAIAPTASGSFTTTTEYSTLTLFTTLFDGKEQVVISSEHVIPEVKISSFTTAPIRPEPSPTVERVHTHYTTYTFYDTTVKGSETILTPSESVITNYVTASGVQESSEIYSISSSPVKDVEIVNVETRVESSVQRSSVVVDRSSEIRTEVGIILPSSTDSGPSIVVVGGQSDTDIDSSLASEPFLSGTSTTVIDGSTVIFFTNFDALGVKPSKASTQKPTTETTTVSVSEDTTTESPITTITTTDSTPTDAETTSQASKTTTESSKDKPAVAAEATPPLKEAVTRTKVITASTHFVGIDKETTSLTPNATLLVVTGTDGSTTNLVHAEITPYADGINPTLALDEELTTTSVSSKPTIKPGSVIELSDLLGGNANLGGNIGEAIKGIVNLITAGQKKNETKEEETKTPERGQPPLPPREGVTVSRQEEPVYIPIGAIGRESEVSDLSPVFRPIDELSERTNDKGDIGSQPSFSPGTLVKGFTPLAEGEVTPVVAGDVGVVSKGIEIAPTRPGSVSPTELVLGPSFGGTTELSGSIHTDRSDSGSSSQPTPAIQGTSVITGAKTIFLGGLGIRPGSKDSTAGTIFFSKGQPSRVGASKESTIFEGEFTPLATSKQKANEYTTITKDGQTIVSKTSSGAKTIFNPFGNLNIESSRPTDATMTTTTKYVTRVESLTRTLTLTTTKIYYTRDSPITITSVFTTTIPPRTFVSTIVGSRTILGNFPEPTETVHIQPSIQPSESTTTVTTTTKIFNDITTTFVRTLVIPTKASKVTSDTHTAGGPNAKSDVEILEAGTERPPGPPPSADSTAVTHSGQPNNGQPKFSFGPRTTPRSPLGNRKPIVLFKANQRPPDPTTTKPPFTGAKPKLSFPTRPPTTTPAPTTKRPPRPKYVPKKNRENEITGCDPECDASKKEICRKNEDDVWACECKTGFARKQGSKICEEIETYVVLLRVVKKGESAVSYRTQFSNSLSTEYQELSELAKKGINEAYKKSDVAENFVGADVLSISDGKDPSLPDLDVSDSEPVGILVNFTVQVAKGTPLGETQLKDELSRSLKNSNFSVGGTELYVDPQKRVVEDVQDFDECRDESYNDCSGSAICTNLVGSYNCTCKEHFQDLDASSPGRVCSGELKSCDYCNGRGDCLTSEDSKRTCKCHRMYIGRRCEINGLVLAIALPLAAAFVIFLVCCFFCCCRRYRREKRKKNKASNVFKGMGLINPLTGTLDKKAMIMDTSSESSGDHPVRPPPPPPPPHAFDNFGAESDMTPKKGSKKSDLSLDRSLSTGFSVPPVVIPRARHQHPKQVNYPNMYGGQAFLQW